MSADGTQAIQRVNYTHEAMIDLLIARPEITQNEVAEHFGYSVPWVSRIIRSDAFREMFASRKEVLVDPAILATIESRFQDVAERSLEVLKEKLSIEAKPSADLALKALDATARALGYGAKAGITINNAPQFVVAMPQKAGSTEEWLSSVKVIEQSAS